MDYTERILGADCPKPAPIPAELQAEIDREREEELFMAAIRSKRRSASYQKALKDVGYPKENVSECLRTAMFGASIDIEVGLLRKERGETGKN